MRKYYIEKIPTDEAIKLILKKYAIGMYFGGRHAFLLTDCENNDNRFIFCATGFTRITGFDLAYREKKIIKVQAIEKKENAIGDNLWKVSRSIPGIYELSKPPFFTLRLSDECMESAFVAVTGKRLKQDANSEKIFRFKVTEYEYKEQPK